MYVSMQVGVPSYLKNKMVCLLFVKSKLKTLRSPVGNLTQLILSACFDLWIPQHGMDEYETQLDGSLVLSADPLH